MRNLKQKRTNPRTVTIDIGLIKTLTEFFRLWAGAGEDDASNDNWNLGHKAARFRDTRFGSRMHRRLAGMLHSEEIRQAVAEALAAAPAQPASGATGTAAAIAVDDEARSVRALAGLVVRKAGELDSDGRARLRWALLDVVGSLYGPEVGNVERHKALVEAGLVVANDNGTADRKAVA
jgi:hypothetical protein